MSYVCISGTVEVQLWHATAISLPVGLSFIHIENQTIHQSKLPQIIDLEEFGIKVHFPSNIISLKSVNVTIGVSLSGNNVVPPPNTTLVSALYYIETSSPLLQPVTIEIQHAASAEQGNHDKKETQITFGRAETMGSSPYILTKLSGGSFSSSCWGTIQLMVLNFCVVGVFGNATTSMDYLANLLYSSHHKGRPGVYHVAVVTFRNLNAIGQVIIITAVRLLYITIPLLFIDCEKRFFILVTNDESILLCVCQRKQYTYFEHQQTRNQAWKLGYKTQTFATTSKLLGFSSLA